MNLNLRSLIGRLNHETRNAVEAAAGLCLSRTHYDVEIEHYMLKLLDAGETDLSAIIKHYGGGPVGIEALAATINDEAETLTELVEPYLLKIGFIVRTPNGRRVTRDAYAHLGLVAPAPASGQPELFA